MDGREAGHRFLEDHGYLAAADGTDGRAAVAQLREVDDVFRAATVEHFAGDDAPGHGHDAQDGLRGYALARAGFADDADGLARVNAKIDAIDRLERAFIELEVGTQPAHGEDAIGGEFQGAPPFGQLTRRDCRQFTTILQAAVH